MPLPGELIMIDEETDLVGDVEAFMATYEQGYYAREWDRLRGLAQRMLATLRPYHANEFPVIRIGE